MKTTNKSKSKSHDKAITKSDLQAAHHTKMLVSPAIEAIQRITPQAIGYDPAAYEKITSFNSWLAGFVSKAEAVINQAQSQLDDRPQRLINAAARRLFQIPECIELALKTNQGLIDGHRAKSDVLIKQGFTKAEISDISPFPQSEIDAQECIIADLKIELKGIEAFLADSPRYDTSLVAGAKLEPFLQHQNAAG